MSPGAQTDNLFDRIDWVLLLAILPVIGAGLVTMHSFGAEPTLLYRQLLWTAIALMVFFTAAAGNYQFLRRRGVAVALYSVAVLVLVAVLLFGTYAGGAQSWFDLGPIRLQPSSPVKLLLIAVLAKYFDRRRGQMHRLRHVFVSGIYALLVFGLVFLQPDFGSAMIIALIWFGMVVTAGISWRHILTVVAAGLISAGLLWMFALTAEQKQRVASFVDPQANLQQAGYNANQATIAVGSGQLLGKGVGYGTQSRLEFLPEYETDFIFAAFAEEWGFVGACLLLLLYAVIFWRISRLARRGETSFERLFGAGVLVYLFSHVMIHAGVNVGILPITGTTMPFMSYGGSHLVVEFLGLGILVGLERSRGRRRIQT
jgi:rod shape determining protein RodA